MLMVLDFLLALLALPASAILKIIRRLGVQHLSLSKKVLCWVGVFPVRRHYYEPLFDCSVLKHPLSEARRLPGINWNTEDQVSLLSQFDFSGELEDVPVCRPAGKLEFYRDNLNFGPGDAESWYNVIRCFAPRRIIEIGSGNSTLMARRAIARNCVESRTGSCEHICIEPYEMPWLEQIGVKVIRSKVEEVDRDIFSTLCENDILFIDSSHVIRPQGDVLVEVLDILPRLRSGVVVHIHDIFSPHDYPAEWVCQRVRFWNEQYLLEAFLSSNSQYKIILALNFLHHFHYEALKSKCPFLSPEHEPGSFYIQRT